MTLKITDFGGIAPAIAPHKLKNLAQVAKNVNLNSGQLEPSKGNKSVATTNRNDIKSIHSYKPGSAQYLFEFTHDVDMVPSQIFDSTRGEMYWTDGVKPKRTNANIATSSAPYPSASYSLGVPAPTEQLTIGEVSGIPPETDFDREDRVYVFTYITREGYESAPSLPATINIGKDQHCNVFGFPTSAPSNYNITGKRVYRGTSAGTELYFAVEMGMTPTVFADNSSSDELGEALVTYDYDLPPDDMIGLTVLANGVLAGFNDNQLCFSEPYIPCAWPKKYRLTTESKIVGIAAIGSGLLVTTMGKPYLALGTTPSSISLQQMDSNQSCVSKKSLVDIGDAAIYASPNGLVRGDASGVRLFGDALFSKEQWQALNPESIHAYYHDEKYIFFYDNGIAKGGYSLDPKKTSGALVELNFYADTGFSDLNTGELYFLNGSDVMSYQDGEEDLDYIWKSGQFELPNLMPYSVCRVVADDYPGELSVIYDGTESIFTFQNDEAFRIPAGRKARFLEVELRGKSKVKKLLLGTDMGAVYE